MNTPENEETPTVAACPPLSGGLAACPFCGGEARPTAHLEYSWFAPVCQSCGVRGPAVRIERGLAPQKLRELLNKADELWNTRVAANAEITGSEAVRVD